MEKITFSKLVRLLTCQPYFVWHNFEDSKQEEEKEESDIKFDFPSFVDYDSKDAFSQIQAKSFAVIENKFVEHIERKYSNTYRIISKTYEEQLIETQEAMKDSLIDIIINPVFEYKHDEEYSAVARPAVYFKKEQQVSFLKLSGSTKRKDFLKMYFDTSVLCELGVPVKNITLFILATREYKKGEVDFYETDKINTSVTPRSDKGSKEILDYPGMQVAKAGYGKNKKGLYFETSNIFKLFESDYIFISNEDIEDNPHGDPLFYLSKIHDFKGFIKYIVRAHGLTTYIKPNKNDVTPWGSNPSFNTLVEEYYPEICGYSGKLIQKKGILENDIDLHAKNSLTLSKVLNIKPNDITIDDENIALIKHITEELNGKVIWYDFEAFSLPLSPMDDFLPFQQVVSQVSTIETINSETINSENLVVDPKNISLDDFCTIVNAIYKKGYKYVVYNESYENTRLKEMCTVLEKNNHPAFDEINRMVSEIIENTIDLAKLFICSKNKPPIIVIPYLKGFYSIKKIEKYITTYESDLPYKIKEYKNLDIQHGMMAMETANQRALGIIGDNEWKIVSKQLQEYCENDVKAMIMVFKFIEKII